MGKCIYCGKELADGAKFCAACGKKQETVNPAAAGSFNQSTPGAVNQGVQQGAVLNQQYSQGYPQYSQQYGYPQQNYQYNQQYVQQGYQQPNAQYNQQNMQQMGAYMGGQAVMNGPGVPYPGAGYTKGFKGIISKKLGFMQILSVIAAILIIISPFLNFASIHAKASTKVVGTNGFASDNYSNSSIYDWYDYDDIDDVSRILNSDITAKAAVGFNLFELSKLSGTISKALGAQNKITMELLRAEFKQGEAMMPRLKAMLTKEIGSFIEYDDSIFEEAFGTGHLILWGRVPLLILPYVIILGGLALLAGTYLGKKIISFIGCGAVLASMLWLMIVSSHFFSMAGFGVLVMFLASCGGIVCTILNKER
ncbi:MAG: zinc ribbon domain-containing protein [Eubacterium sp.]|nr:zinc ribbon domain-containing protein [Eubacterium sp.]